MGDVIALAFFAVILLGFFALIGIDTYLDHRFRSEHPEEWLKARQQQVDED